MSRLADHERISKPSATGIVGRLVERGLVERSKDPSDRRSAIVAITAEGRHTLEDRRRERTAYLTRRIEALDVEDREILDKAAALLEQMVEES